MLLTGLLPWGSPCSRTPRPGAGGESPPRHAAWVSVPRPGGGQSGEFQTEQDAPKGGGRVTAGNQGSMMAPGAGVRRAAQPQRPATGKQAGAGGSGGDPGRCVARAQTRGSGWPVQAAAGMGLGGGPGGSGGPGGGGSRPRVLQWLLLGVGTGSATVLWPGKPAGLAPTSLPSPAQGEAGWVPLEPTERAAPGHALCPPPTSWAGLPVPWGPARAPPLPRGCPGGAPLPLRDTVPHDLVDLKTVPSPQLC